jgi:hypothetical protein
VTPEEREVRLRKLERDVLILQRRVLRHSDNGILIIIGMLLMSLVLIVWGIGWAVTR